ncbi:MAG TPA: SWIM zinc finger family protein [Streptosporangiaceae bacterium]|nr:SWIM zinc finger family protein [Streptosporangiaceae bacterium]
MTAIVITSLTEADLLEAAGQRSYSRGLGYLDAVADLAVRGDKITASVRGTDEYIVMLTVGRGGDLIGACDCPYGQEGFFCKHCVAVGLAYLRSASLAASGGIPAPRTGNEAEGQAVALTDSPGPGAGPAPAAAPASAAAPPRAHPAAPASAAAPAPAPAPAHPAAPVDAAAPAPAMAPPDADAPAAASGLLSWLNSLSRDDLLGLVLDQIIEDEDWRDRLFLRATAADADLETILADLADLLDPAGFGEYGYVDEGESRRYASRVAAAMDVVADLIDAEQADEAIEVAEYAIDLVATGFQHALDPAGAIWAAVCSLLMGHEQACRAGQPDPEFLAEFLAVRMINAAGLPVIDISAYREPLGPTGVAALGEILTAEASSSLSYHTDQALEEFLRGYGDTDALVARLSANLPPNGFGQLRIARELMAADRPDEALDWAERGLREAVASASSGAAIRPAPELVDFVAERYAELGRADDALAVRRDAFAVSRDVRTYEQLRVAAGRAGADGWPATRNWALDLLRADADALRSDQQGLRLAGEPVLIDVLVAEGDGDAAWEAAPGIASEDQWRRIARLIEPTRPADALAIYQRQIEPLKRETGDRVYERMAALLLRARECHRRLGTEASFHSYLRALRADQKRKPKLMSVLDSHQLRPARSAPGD